MRICILASEVAPLAKTGGLGDVAGAYQRLCVRVARDVMTVTPFYSETPQSYLGARILDGIEIDWQGGKRAFSVWYTEHTGAPTFLIEFPDYFSRPGIYGYGDDHEALCFLQPGCHTASSPPGACSGRCPRK
ncbi:MAG: glycogen/starch synthase [Pyrinomonadaceae bacterium]